MQYPVSQEDCRILYYHYAKKLYKREDFKSALKLFRCAFRMKPTDACMNNIGCCLIALQRYEDAECCYSALLQKRPEWIQPYINMARVYWNSEAYEKEYPYLVKAAEIDANNVDLLFYLGSYYYAMEEYDKSIEYLNKSIDIDFDQADGHLTLGATYYKAEMYQQALQEFQIGYEMNRSDINALYDQALAYSGLEDYPAALPILLEVVKTPSDNPKYMYSLGHCYFHLHEYENAKKAFEAALKIDPENEYTQNFLKRVSEMI